MLKLYSLIVLHTLGILTFEINVPNNETKTDQNCEFCIQDQCMHMTENKCEYYSKVDEILNNQENDVIQVANQTEIKEINAVLYDFVNEGLVGYEDGKCVPLISQYTDCHRDNICTGCYFCKCDSSGDWDCTARQKCEHVSRASTVSTHRLLSFMIAMFFKPGYSPSVDNETEQFNLTTNDVHPFITSHQTIRQKRENLHPKYVNNKYTSTRDLKLNALYPLTNIIHEKVAETSNLSKIRNYLIEYLQSLGVADVTNEINDVENLKDNFKNPEFVIYKFETNRDTKLRSRKAKPNLLHRINDNIKQLASDIYYAEKKNYKKNKSKIPDDLKKIMLILTQYINKQNDTKMLTRKSNIRNDWTGPIEIWRANETNINYNNKSDGFKIDKNFTLTDSTHNFLRRIAENLDLMSHSDHADNFTYNIVDTLSQVGRTWRKLYYNIKNSNFYNRFDSIKLLHLTLSIDINKITKMLNTLTTENFSKMKLVDKRKCGVLIYKIDLGFSLMQKSIMKMSLGNKYLSNDDIKHHYNITTDLKNYKDTLVHRIRKVLKNTKNNVVAILKSKFTHHLSKALTSKELARLNEKKLKKYESVMLDWQNKLNVRRKRSVLGYQPKTRKIRLTHILPKYLRGKMNPIIIDKKNNKNSTKNQLQKKH